MRVSVVKVWPVRVGMRYRIMPVAVRVSMACRQAGMEVSVMAVIVTMGMRVLEGFVGVNMAMSIAEEKSQGPHEQPSAQEMRRPDRFTQHQP